jgi:hypothetical protein
VSRQPSTVRAHSWKLKQNIQNVRNKQFQNTLMVLLGRVAGSEKAEAAAERRKLRNKHPHA